MSPDHRALGRAGGVRFGRLAQAAALTVTLGISYSSPVFPVLSLPVTRAAQHGIYRISYFLAQRYMTLSSSRPQKSSFKS